ncbi:MAG: hypothetical protein NUW24_02350 [Anaerolineae bacterium]|jgi:hypothetical protein|nr:hypothetical protein [Anaerolineae bacterium]MDH7473601.1 hypothetical protein [Anaerolineae bacterium]
MNSSHPSLSLEAQATDPPARRNLAWLIGLGTLSAAVYAWAFPFRFPLVYLYDTPFIDLGKLTKHTHAGALNFALSIFVLFVLYWVAYSKTGLSLSHGKASLSPFYVTVGFAVLFFLILALAYPIGAADVFDYMLGGRILAHYRVNPYTHSGADFLPGDPFAPYAPYFRHPSYYGPLWTLFAAGTNLLAGTDNLLANLWAFKALALAFYLMDVGLIYLIVRGCYSERALGAAFLFAWNPLVLFETAVNAHNDVVMMAFVLLGVYLFQRQRYHSMIAAVVASALIKVASAFLVPVFFLAALWALPDWRKRISFLISGGVVAVSVMVLLYLPFWEGSRILTVGRRFDMFTSSFPTLLMLLLSFRLSQGLAKQIASSLATAVFAVFYGWQLPKLRGSLDSLLRTSYALTLFFLLFICLWFQPWYIIWVMALAALLSEIDAVRQSVLFTYGGTWAYVVYHFVWFWYVPIMNWGNTLGVHTTAVVAIFVWPLAYGVYRLVGRRRAGP